MSETSGLTDQIKAAVADARQRVAAGGPVREVPDDETSATSRLAALLDAQLDKGFAGDCQHFQPRAAQPVHWIPGVPEIWQCDSCAQRLVDEWLRVDYHRCDLCRRSLASEPAPVLIHQTAGMVIIHAVLCPGCAPGDST